jgi:hypothetical protein
MTVTNSSGLKTGQGALPNNLQTLHYNLGDMHNLTHKIQGDMASEK